MRALTRMDLSWSSIDCLSRSSALCSCSLLWHKLSIFISKSLIQTDTRNQILIDSCSRKATGTECGVRTFTCLLDSCCKCPLVSKTMHCCTRDKTTGAASVVLQLTENALTYACFNVKRRKFLNATVPVSSASAPKLSTLKPRPCLWNRGLLSHRLTPTL